MLAKARSVSGRIRYTRSCQYACLGGSRTKRLQVERREVNSSLYIL